MEFSKVEGLIAPAFTPMKENGDLALERIPEYAEDLMKKGLSGVFILGSAGEGMLLTVEERKAVTEAWAPYSDENFKMIVHVGSTSHRQSRDLAIHARGYNAWGISSIGPVFLQPNRANELVDFCSHIASGAPDLPFYYYHIPVRSGVNVKMPEFLSLGSKRIPNLAGIKFNHSNLMEMQQCIMMDNGKFDIVHGSDPTFLSGLAIGIKGAIGTTYNYIPGLFLKIVNAFNEGDLTTAQQYQKKAVKVIEVLSKYGGGVTAGKGMQNVSGVNCGPPRSPVRELSQQELEKMSEDLKKVDFFKMVENQ